LQKAFASECDKSRIWYSERNNIGVFKQPELKKFEKAFYKRNYYSVIENDSPSDKIEKRFYGKIDDYLGKLLPEVIDTLDAGEVPMFTGSSLTSLQECVFQMAKRTPEFTKEYDDLAVGKELASAIVDETSNPREKDKFRRLLNNPHRLREYGRDIRVRATLPNSEQVKNALQELSVRWAISKSNHSFILCSLITYRIGNGGKNGLSNPNFEIWMPVSPKYCMLLLRDSKRNIPWIVPETRDHVRQINDFAAKNSRQIASHSKRLIESIIKNCPK